MSNRLFDILRGLGQVVETVRNVKDRSARVVKLCHRLLEWSPMSSQICMDKLNEFKKFLFGGQVSYKLN